MTAPAFSELAARMDADIYTHLFDPARLDGETVRGMFQAPWQQPRMGTMSTGIVEPVLVVRDADASKAAEGSLAEINGGTYEVVSIEPDGTGLTALVLREVQP